MRHLVYTVIYSAVPTNFSLLTVTSYSPVITSSVYNDRHYSPSNCITEFDCIYISAPERTWYIHFCRINSSINHVILTIFRKLKLWLRITSNSITFTQVSWKPVKCFILLNGWAQILQHTHTHTHIHTHTHTHTHTYTAWQSQATSYLFRKGTRLQEFEGVFVTVAISHTVAIIINMNRNKAVVAKLTDSKSTDLCAVTAAYLRIHVFLGVYAMSTGKWLSSLLNPKYSGTKHLRKVANYLDSRDGIMPQKI